jgi:type IV pilus assembly protein PilZ
MKTTVQRSAPHAVERRRWERAELVVRVDYKTVDELFSEFARNINEGGLFVETDSPPALGASVALEFQIPGSDEPIQVMGRVVRVCDDSHRDGPGMGIEFENLDTQSRDLINELVRQLRVGAREGS